MGNLSEYGITYIVIYVLLWYHFGFSLGKTYEYHACYDGAPKIIMCNESEKISIYDLEYETNCSSCYCDSYASCEKFKLPGSWKNHYYYGVMSGQQSTTFFTQRVGCPIGGTSLYSNQMHLSYKCVIEKIIIDFCEIFGQTEGRIVYLQYTRFENRQKKKDCHCYATTSSGGLQIHAVDIRFPNDTSGICGDNQNSYLQFDSVNQSIKCNDNQLLGGYTIIFNTTNPKIDILLHLDGNPHSVWIGISALTGDSVNVSCKNTPPIESTELILSTTISSSEVRTSKDAKTSTYSEPQGTTEIEYLSTGITAKTGESVNVSCNNTPPTEVVSTDAIISTAITIGNVRTSKAEKTSTNSEKTSIANGTTISSVPTTIQFNSENLIHTNEPQEITEMEYLSTTSVNPIVPKEILPEKIKIERMIDPAIIVLILTGLLSLVLVIIGFVLGRIRYAQSRLDRQQFNAIREKIQLDSRDTDLNTKPNHYTTFTSDNESRLQPLVTEEDNSNNLYSQVEKKRRNDQLANNYDHVNYQGSIKSVNSSIYNTPDSYDHLHPNMNPRKCYGQYDTVEIGNCETNYETRIRNSVLETSEGISSESDRVEQYINPYVDEVVIKGMLSDNEFRRSLSSFIDVDESIRDMITHATNWAEEERV